MDRRPDQELEPRRGQSPRGRSGDDFFGLEAERMSPKAQVTTSLAVIVPVVLAGVFLFAFTSVWWIWFTFFWVVFPAFGLLVRGIAGLSESSTELPAAANSKERELLEALRREGELTPARAAMETSLSVAEADQMLKDLAAGGHLEVRTRGVGLTYALWASPTAPEGRYLEARTSVGEKGAT